MIDHRTHFGKSNVLSFYSYSVKCFKSYKSNWLLLEEQENNIFSLSKIKSQGLILGLFLFLICNFDMPLALTLIFCDMLITLDQFSNMKILSNSKVINPLMHNVPKQSDTSTVLGHYTLKGQNEIFQVSQSSWLIIN